MMNQGFKILTVSQLNYYTKSLLEEDPHLNAVFVRGEISNFTNHYRSGHFYMTVKDENASIKAVMFKGSAQRLKFMPRDGMKVILFGRVSLYERDGQYQLYIDDLQPDGTGALYAAYEQLKEKLRVEGLFDESKKKPLPLYPEKIGVITSPIGAALQDILNILKRRWPAAEILFYPALVQGSEAPAQLCKAVNYFSSGRLCDVLIIGRGGGSLEDLWAFNDENLARCIASSAVPVVAAVGHETDFTIADFAADLRAPTPSAAAELISPDKDVVTEEFLSQKTYIKNIILCKIFENREGLTRILRSAALRSPQSAFEIRRMQLDYLCGRLKNTAIIKVSEQKEKLASLASALDAMSPLKVLHRGYSIVYNENKEVVSSIRNLKTGGNLCIRIQDGEISCGINDICGLKTASAKNESKGSDECL